MIYVTSNIIDGHFYHIPITANLVTFLDNRTGLIQNRIITKLQLSPISAR